MQDLRQQLVFAASALIAGGAESPAAGAGRIGAENIGVMKALAHTDRIAILGLYAAGPLTAKETAVALAAEPARASYHVKRLLAAGLLELDRTQVTTNGIVAKYYRLSADGRRVLQLDPVPVA